MLVTRGVKQVIATETNPRALVCASENIQHLNMHSNIQVVQADLFPEGKADLIVCNPPWLPAKANTTIEQAVYDPDSQMLRGFLSGVKSHLNPTGEAWLVMSDLAELIGLRKPDELTGWIAEAGLEIIERSDTQPKHGKAQDKQDPLFAARSKEVTSLYRLKLN